jgi:hypothetical protein
MWPVYQAIKAEPLSPLSHITGGGFGAAYSPLPPSQQHSMACDVICLSVVDPRPFSAQLLNSHAHEVPRGLI